MTIETSSRVLKNFINGEWVKATTEQLQSVPNPATGEEIALVPISSKEDVNIAVQAAKDAFKTWGKTPVPKRARILFKYQQLLVDQWGELARLITKENGKNLTEAYGEVQRGIECVGLRLGLRH